MGAAERSTNPSAANVRDMPALVHVAILPSTPMKRLLCSTAVLALVNIAAGVGAPANDDWPQYLGAARDGAYRGVPLADRWPVAGPRVVWKRPVGAGFSGPVVADGKLILFHRIKNRRGR